MLTLDDAARDSFRSAVQAAGSRLAAARSAVAPLRAGLAAATAERRPVCVNSGRCCRFETYGHRLFVTPLELAVVLADAAALRRSPELAAAEAAWSGEGCPFQAGGGCGIHPHRPLGCRVYFCDETSDDWQSQQYEAFHAGLKEAHTNLNVPYQYVEWREALRAMSITAAGDRRTPGRHALPVVSG
ncbi:MAG: hypothetical protein ACFCVE_14300 [Phycisphaerae bacterium]